MEQLHHLTEVCILLAYFLFWAAVWGWLIWRLLSLSYCSKVLRNAANIKRTQWIVGQVGVGCIKWQQCTVTIITHFEPENQMAFHNPTPLLSFLLLTNKSKCYLTMTMTTCCNLTHRHDWLRHSFDVTNKRMINLYVCASLLSRGSDSQLWDWRFKSTKWKIHKNTGEFWSILWLGAQAKVHKIPRTQRLHKPRDLFSMVQFFLFYAESHLCSNCALLLLRSVQNNPLLSK